MTQRYRVRPTDCRTGFQVVAPNGSVYITTRRRGPALECAAELNTQLNADAAHAAAFYADQSADFIRRTTGDK